jgi:hypothetical protein
MQAVIQYFEDSAAQHARCSSQRLDNALRAPTVHSRTLHLQQHNQTYRCCCCCCCAQVWVYGNSFKSVLVAVVVPKEDAIKAWAAANGKSGEWRTRGTPGAHVQLEQSTA